MKKIILDPLDPKSIESAIKQLEEHITQRKQLMDVYIRRLAEVGAEAARRTYGSSVTVDAHKIDKGWEIRADGERVVFLEFGAGAWTKSHELAGPLPITIEPGSWSMTEGKRTWQNVIDGKVSPENYRYNLTPHPGMWEAYKAIEAAQERIAEEVFGK